MRYLAALFARVKRVFLRLVHAEAVVYAGYLAFLTLLGLVPMLAVAYWLSEQSSIAKVVDSALREYLTTHLFPDSAQGVLKTIEQLRVNARTLGLTALIAIGVDVLLKAQALTGAMRRIVGLPATWGSTLRAHFVLVLLLPICVAATAWGLSFLEHFIVALIPGLKQPVKWVLLPFQVSAPMWVGLVVLYRGLVPQARRWRGVMVTSAGVMLALEGLRLIMTGYFAQLAQVKSLYGAFSVFPVLLMSVFLSWLLVLVGAAWLTESVPRLGKNRA
jgi:membrane protein